MAHQHVVTSYMEHGYCLNWEKPLLFLHVGSDIITGISYYSIPIAMFYFAYRRRDLPFFKIFIMFAVFIISCGTTHFFGAYTMYRPEYWIEGYVKAFTALISAITAIIFIPRIPDAIAFPSLMNSMEEVKKLNSELGSKNAELRKAHFSIENVNDAIYWISEAGRILHVNETACKTLGYKADEMLGFTVVNLDPYFPFESWPNHWNELKEKGTLTFETLHRTKNGGILEVEVTANYISYEGEQFNCAIARDITLRKSVEKERQAKERRMASLYNISQYPFTGEQEFLDHALNEVIDLTNSKFGYIYFYNEENRQFILNTWSHEVMNSCSVVTQQTIYDLDNTGIWGEAVRQRKPIMLNNFQEHHPLKKGYPEGHVAILSFLTVPIIIEDAIVAVVGVANKQTDYTETDVMQLTLFMDSVWMITMRKRAEAALRVSESKHRRLAHEQQLILNCSSVGIALLKNRKVQWANPAFDLMFGYEAGSSIDMDTAELYFDKESYLAVGIKAYPAIQSGSTYSQDVMMKKKDGSEIWCNLVGQAVSVGNPEEGSIWVLIDISERKRAEEMIEKRLVTLTQPIESGVITFEELFNINDLQRLQDEFAKATGVASLIIYPDGTSITAPSNFTRLCSDIIRTSEKGCANCRTSDAAIGRFNPEGPIIQPCLSGGLWDAGAAIVVNKQHIASWLIGQVRDETQTEDNMRAYAREINVDQTLFMEAFLEVPSMTREHFDQIAQVLFTLANQLSTTAYQNILQARFINERKRAEEVKSQLEEQLQQTQKMESVGRLAGGVAHDFNNMLGVILGHASLALMETDQSHPLFANLEEIRKAAERSADLTRQLLAFARKQTIAPKVLDLNETVNGMLKMLQRLIGEDIHLVWQPADKLWPVKADPSQIDQILANLCVNASDSISDIGKISIETANCSIDENYTSSHAEALPGEYVSLAVSDDGSGIDKETMLHIFEPFFTTKDAGDGTGLGLATVFGAVKQNNGFINVYSEPGMGTTFTIYLPRHFGNTEQTQTEVSLLPRGQETILLVEDELSILKMASLLLTKQGYNVLQANSPGEAIRLTEEHVGEIHLLMTDVVMPEMNGRDLAQALQNLYPQLKCLYMSGYTADVIAHHGVLNEGVHFIQKPFSLPDLATKVQEVLYGR